MDFEDPIAELACKQFGILSLNPMQRLAIANILDSETEGPVRQLVLLPTGFGKSLCFQLPSLILPRPTLVIYPLLALMSDQERSLKARGIQSVTFRGGMTLDEKKEARARILGGTVPIIITNPEMLVHGDLGSFLGDAGLSHIAIDEAHCVSEWGETFRPAYLELGEVVEKLKAPALSAFTATASPLVSGAIVSSIFRGESYRSVAADPDRSNIHFSVQPTLNRHYSLRRLIMTRERPLIIFCQSRDSARLLAWELGLATGLDVKFYHAGLTREEKKEVELWFMKSGDGILTATCAYGMGVDKADVRTVIHYEAPASIEAYLQEAGRAGRDRQPSSAILLSETGFIIKKREGEDKTRELRRKLMADYGSSTGCRRETLLGMMGVDKESVICTGCDICDGQQEEVEGLSSVLSFFLINGRRFDRKQGAKMLSGKKKSMLSWGACSGTLSSWTTHEVDEAIGATLRAGMLEEGKGFPWQGRLGITKTGRDRLALILSRIPKSKKIHAANRY